VSVVNNGSQNVYQIDGVNNAPLTLKNGHIYHFTHSTGHPFKFSTTADGTHNSGSEYTTGVRVIGNNIVEIRITTTTPTNLYYYCQFHSGMGGSITKDSSDAMQTVLALDSADHDYVVRSNERRPSDKGKVVSVGSSQEELLILEDGGRIENEEIVYTFALEPTDAEMQSGDIVGDSFLLEDNSKVIMEDETFDDTYIERFFTERAHTLVSSAPLGGSLRSLNTITGQQVYNISYYLKEETDGDDFTLEDGTGNIMSEESKPEGISISDLDTYFPKHTVNYYSDVPNLRTNIAFSSYIKSA